MRPRRIPDPRDPATIMAVGNAGIDRELRRQEREEEEAYDREEWAAARARRAAMPPGIDHSKHECNNDPTDPWSECTVARPY